MKKDKSTNLPPVKVPTVTNKKKSKKSKVTLSTLSGIGCKLKRLELLNVMKLEQNKEKSKARRKRQ